MALKTPSLKEVSDAASNVLRSDNRNKREIERGVYSLEHWKHFHYIFLTLDRSIPRSDVEDVRVRESMRGGLLPDAYRAAAKAFGITKIEARLSWELVSH